jgi:putative transposase
MVKNGYLSKSISDVAWGQLIGLTTCKAACAGRRVVFVDPRGTSQRCSRCGEKVKKSLAERTHHCHLCGLSLDRDHNAALNILSLGLQTVGLRAIKALPFKGGE